MDKRTRLEVPDIMKGLCIILVMLQHCFLLPDADSCVLTRVYLSMNMPMFFFVSGLFLPVGRSFGRVVGHSAQRLLLPWLVFALLSGAVVDAFSGDFDLTFERFGNWLIIWSNTPLYFLRALFMAMLMAWTAARVCRTAALQAVALVVFSAASWAVVTFDPRFGYYVGWREAVSMLMYMWLGHMLVCALGRERLLNMKPAVAAVLVVVSLAAACLLNPGRMRWHYQQTSESWGIITLSALLGIAAIWGLAVLLRRLRPLSLLGRYTMQVLSIHYFFLVLIMRTFDVSRQQAFLPMLLLLVPMIYCVQRWTPVLFGETPKLWKKNALTT